MVLNPATRTLCPLELVSTDNFANAYRDMKREPVSRNSLKGKKMSAFVCHSRRPAQSCQKARHKKFVDNCFSTAVTFSTLSSKEDPRSFRAGSDFEHPKYTGLGQNDACCKNKGILETDLEQKGKRRVSEVFAEKRDSIGCRMWKQFTISIEAAETGLVLHWFGRWRLQSDFGTRQICRPVPDYVARRVRK